MIQAVELVLLTQLQAFWSNMVAGIGTAGDIIPDIFANLPADGDFGANWKAISDNFTRMNTGNQADDITFILQFPAAKAQIPTVCIETGQEMEMEIVSSFVQEDFNPSNQKWEQQIGGPYVKTFAIGIHSFNADVTLYLYSAIKYGLLLFRNSFGEGSNIIISGRPMMIDYQTYNPEVVYSRYFDLRVEGVMDTAIVRYDTVRHTDAVGRTQ